MIIYKITSPSGKSYIGQTKNSIEFRWNQHRQLWNRLSKNQYKTSSKKLFFAFNKYPEETWIKEIICECASKEELNEKEQHYIEFFNSIKNGYNISKGGDGRIVDFLDEEHKQNIANSRKEFYETEEGKKWKEELSKRYLGEGNPTFGKKYKKTNEVKKLISEKMKGKNKGKIPWNKGKSEIYSEESLKNMSENRKGKGLGKDNSRNMLGKKQTDYQKQRVSEAKGKTWIVIDPEGNKFEVFSLNKFCKENGLDQGNLSRGKYKGYKAYVK